MLIAYFGYGNVIELTVQIFFNFYAKYIDLFWYAYYLFCIVVTTYNDSLFI